MRAIYKLILAGVLTVVFGSANAEIVAPDTLMQNTVQEILAIVKQDKDIQAGNKEKVLALVDAKIVPHFDFVRMTQLAVGKYWRTASAEQKQVMVKEFQTMLVRTYTAAFSGYKNQTVEVTPVKMADADTEATVKTKILKPGAPAISVSYVMEKTANGWKVFDLVTEGSSLVMSSRNTFAKQIEDGGIDGLIKALVDKNASLANATAKADSK
ncbi:MAG: ABC transporter substrate-binding protein [Gallionella sp.]|nr:ABC transporter substrate-binding protein [Gallionella sp.]